jgi:hypothetical protein
MTKTSEIRIPISEEGIIDVEKALKNPDALQALAKTFPGQYVLLHGPTAHIARAVNVVAEAGWRVVSHSVAPGIPSPIAYVFMMRAQPVRESK